MYTKEIKNLSQKDTLIAGGKGASLGEMIQAKILIPTGFVVLVSAFNMFLRETDLDVEVGAVLKKVNYKDINSVEKASEEIRYLVENAKFPKDIADEIQKEFRKLKVSLVAVRSSATAEDSFFASWAGELESCLNVDKNNLLESVKKCWSSLFTPRAIFYRFERGLHNKKVSVGVVVQKMIQSEVSGVVFTVHPITRDGNQMVIEAGYGLGDAIGGGKITPDTYIIHKDSLAIIDKNISEQRILIAKKAKCGTAEKAIIKTKQNKQKLNDEHIVNLAKVCLDIEKHYKKPQDIEWALEKGKLYIVQSRPITTL